MKTFEEVVQNLNAEYSRATRDLRIYRENEDVLQINVPESDAADYWYGAEIDGVDVDFNFCEAEEGGEDMDNLCVYEVIDGHTKTSVYQEIPVKTM